MESTSEHTCADANRAPTYVAGGPVQVANGIYLPRPADQQLLDHSRAGAFAYVLTSRQMGKSSLIFRTAEQLLGNEVRSVIVDLTELGSILSADQWYGGMVEAVGEQLGLSATQGWWVSQKDVGIAQRFTRFFREVVLPAIPERIVVFFDEIDSTLGLQFTDDFFAAIRFLYHLRVNAPELNRLSFVLIGVASPDDLIKDARRTPFNIGARVELTDFTSEQAWPLVQGLPIANLEALLFLDWVLSWTGGHPYLTLRVFRKFQEDSLPWVPDDAVIQQLFFGTEDAPDSNIEFVRKMLVRDDPIRSGVLATYQAICRGQGVKDDGSSAVKTWLKLSGLAARKDGLLRVRNRIYETVFTQEWLAKARGELGRPPAEAVLPMEVREAGNTAILESSEQESQGFGGTLPRRLTNPAPRFQFSRNLIEHSVLLAIESMNLSPNPEANQCLHENLPLMRTLMLRMKHQQRVTAALFSADGLYAASSSEDQTALVFETSTRREVASVQHRDRIWDIAFSPDSQLFATASWDGSARIWSVRGGRRLAELEHEDCVAAVRFSPDGKRVVTASWDHTARVWDISRIGDQKVFEEQTLQHGDRVVALAFNADGKRVATASWDNTARLWETRTGRELAQFEHRGRVVSVAFSPDGSTVVTAGEDSVAVLWDSATGSKKAQLPHDGRITCLVISSDGLRLATASEDRSARVWELATGCELTRLHHRGRVTAVSFGPDTLVATASEDCTARIWNGSTGRELARLSHDGRVTCASFSADGALAISAGEDGTARVWRAKPPREMLRYMHQDQVRSVAFSPNGSRVASGSEDFTARVWDTVEHREVLRLSHEARVTSVAFRPDGRRLVTASEDGGLRIWSTDGELHATLSHPSWVYCAAFHPDGARVASACEDGLARILNTVTSEEILRLPHEGRVWFVAFNEAGDRLASAGADSFVRLWDCDSGTLIASVESTDQVFCIALHGTLLATGSADGVTRLWSMETGRELRRFLHDSGVYTLAFSPDGRTLIAGCGDGTVRIWDMSTGDEVARWTEGNRVYHATFHPNGKVVAVAADQAVQLSLWAPDDLVAFARRHVTRNLTATEWNDHFGGEPYRQTYPGLP